MPYLLHEFRSKGGVIIAKKVESLEELIGAYDVVVNCTGLGARGFVHDQLVHPIRGHIFRVDPFSASL